jgi:hypothetical protein
MGSGIEGVVAALKVALEEAQTSDEDCWDVKAANRWIDKLPGAWLGRWRQLRLAGDSAGEVLRSEFVGHVRAVLAYLETNGKEPPRSFGWRRQRSLPQTMPAETKPTIKGSRLVH